MWNCESFGHFTRKFEIPEQERKEFSEIEKFSKFEKTSKIFSKKKSSRKKFASNAKNFKFGPTDRKSSTTFSSRKSKKRQFFEQKRNFLANFFNVIRRHDLFKTSVTNFFQMRQKNQKFDRFGIDRIIY